MLQLENVNKIYNRNSENQFQALFDINLEIEDGELVAVIGTSGAGKSSLLHILACIDTYEKGNYYMDEQLIKELTEAKMAQIRNENIGLVMQDYALIETYTALENVMLPLDFSKKHIRNKKELAQKALQKVGLEKVEKKEVRRLSGGQKQRVAIARAIVNNPKFLLADEPTGALDAKTTEEIISLFQKLNQAGMTTVIVTHDKEVAEKCNRVIEIRDGRVI